MIFNDFIDMLHSMIDFTKNHKHEHNFVMLCSDNSYSLTYGFMAFSDNTNDQYWHISAHDLDKEIKELFFCSNNNKLDLLNKVKNDPHSFPEWIDQLLLIYEIHKS